MSAETITAGLGILPNNDAMSQLRILRGLFPGDGPLNRRAGDPAFIADLALQFQNRPDIADQAIRTIDHLLMLLPAQDFARRGPQVLLDTSIQALRWLQRDALNRRDLDAHSFYTPRAKALNDRLRASYFLGPFDDLLKQYIAGDSGTYKDVWTATRAMIEGHEVEQDRFPFLVDFERSSGLLLRVRDIRDSNERDFLDCSCGFGSSPFGVHPDWLDFTLEDRRLIEEAARGKPALADYHSPVYIAMREKLFSMLGLENPDDWYFFQSNAGADAIESAISTASYSHRQWIIDQGIIEQMDQEGQFGTPDDPRHDYNKRAFGKGIITFNKEFHGRTTGGRSATSSDPGYRKDRPEIPDVFFAPHPVQEGGPQATIAAIEKELEENPYKYCMIMIEPISGEGGNWEVPIEVARRLRELADKYHVAFVLDEIQSGLWRTGTPLAHQQIWPGVEVDGVALAKHAQNGV